MKKLISIIFLTLISNSYAYQLPRFLGNEQKFRSYVYNPNHVYRYFGHYTYQAFLEFGKEENIQTLSIGKQSAWMLNPLGNRLFLKPIEDDANTNMTVITNKRIYHFELLAKEASGIEDKDLIFAAKFIYPDIKDKNIVNFPSRDRVEEPDMSDLTKYNFNYEFTGEPSAAPVKIFDDGKFTYFQFSERNSELPAIFSVDSTGLESLVNFRITKNYIIVEKVSAQFTLRNGNDIVCVYNNKPFFDTK